MWRAISILVCLVTLFVAGMVFNKMDRLTTAVERLTLTVDRLMLKAEERPLSNPNELYSEWHSAGSPPILRSVTTVRMEGETVRSWEDRHDAAVANLRTTYPPV